MKKNIFKKFMGFCLAIVMVVGCALSLTGCGKQETEDAGNSHEALVGTTWLADYFVSDSFGKLTLEESIEQGYIERDSSYVLEFADEETCYIRMVHGDMTSSEEKLSYEFDGKKLTFLNGNVSDAEYDVSDGITLTHAAGSDMTTFHFILRDDVNSETDSRPENQSQGESQLNAQPNITAPEPVGQHEVQLNADGKYVYHINNHDIVTSINIWEYIDSDNNFDIVRMLEDWGFDQIAIGNATNGVNSAKSTSRNLTGLLFIGPEKKDAIVNDTGLMAYDSWYVSDHGYTFKISYADALESIYSVNHSTVYGMSEDQIILLAACIEYMGSTEANDYIFKLLTPSSNTYYIP